MDFPGWRGRHRSRKPGPEMSSPCSPSQCESDTKSGQEGPGLIWVVGNLVGKEVRLLGLVQEQETESQDNVTCKNGNLLNLRG